MAEGTIMSFAVPGYSGMLYEKGNNRAPLITSIINNMRYTNSVKFVLGQEYTEEDGAIPAISEQASLTAPAPTYISRSQKYNVTQIYHETLAISDAKKSNMGTLSGVNIEGQYANPQAELDFQIARKMSKIRKSMEKAFINGTFNEATADNEINKTRGLVQAVTTNTLSLTPSGGTAKTLDIWAVEELMHKIAISGGDITNLTLFCDYTTRMQLVGNAVELGVPLGQPYVTAYGIRVEDLILESGVVRIMTGYELPAGTALLLNMPALHPVAQPVPGKGNFYLEELGKTGAGEKYQIFGQMGLDYGMEFLHGKFTGIATTFTKPIGRKVVTVTEG